MREERTLAYGSAQEEEHTVQFGPSGSSAMQGWRRARQHATGPTCTARTPLPRVVLAARCWPTTLALLLFCAPAEAAEAPAAAPTAVPSPESCLACHGDPALRVRTPKGQLLSLHVDPGTFHASVHGSFPCVACHSDLVMPGVAHPTGGAPPAPVELTRTFAPAERACAGCHPDVFRQYQESVHAAAVRRGDIQAPTCKDCHGAHNIRRAEDLESSVSAANVPATCAKCHAQSTLMARYNINTRVVQSYGESFHGKKRRLGSQSAAVCTSCHGIHAIRAPSDPKSKIFPANRPHTCGQRGCHTGATATFALGFSHTGVSRAQRPLAYWIQTFYLVMIGGSVGLMFLYMAADLWRRVLRAARREVAR